MVGERTSMFYDARGTLTKTLRPDGAMELRVLGHVPDLTKPDEFEPSAWTVTVYDANDLALLTNNDEAANVPSSHHYTAKTEIVDQLGRVIKSIDRLSVDPVEVVVMQYSYDLVGNLLQVIDPLERQVFAYTYDFMKRRLGTNHLDSGQSFLIPDALGQPIVTCNANFAVSLQIIDDHGRPITVFGCRNDSDFNNAWWTQSTFSYGTVGVPNTYNQIGRLVEQRDTAGQLTDIRYDYRGNVNHSTRQFFDSETLLGAMANNDLIADRANNSNWDSNYNESTNQIALFDNLARPIYTQVTAYAAALPPLNVITATTYNTYYTTGTLKSTWLEGHPPTKFWYNAKGQNILRLTADLTIHINTYNPLTDQLQTALITKYEDNGFGDLVFTDLVQKFTYTYDLVGNIVTLETETDQQFANEVKEMTYDPLYRLLSATGTEKGLWQDSIPWKEWDQA